MVSTSLILSMAASIRKSTPQKIERNLRWLIPQPLRKSKDDSIHNRAVIANNKDDIDNIGN